jgi:hypothetical protein
MLMQFCGCDKDLIPICPSRVERRQRIAAEMARVAKASEANLPPDERRQVIDLTEPAEFAPVRRASDDLIVLRAWRLSSRVRTGFAIVCTAAAATCAALAWMCAGSALHLATLPLLVLGAGCLALPMIVNLVRQ